MSTSNLCKLQKVQNAAARLVARKRKIDGISASIKNGPEKPTQPTASITEISYSPGGADSYKP